MGSFHGRADIGSHALKPSNLLSTTSFPPPCQRRMKHACRRSFSYGKRSKIMSGCLQGQTGHGSVSCAGKSPQTMRKLPHDYQTLRPPPETEQIAFPLSGDSLNLPPSVWPLFLTSHFLPDKTVPRFSLSFNLNDPLEKAP